MKSPSWLQGYVESLDIPPLGRYRSDCPVCARKNTFSVSDDGLQRLWFCFHADCNVSGRTGITLTKDFAKHALSRSQTNASVTRTSNTYEMPDTFVSLSRNLDAELYVRSVHAYDAYLSGRADIRYDFKRNRVVFLVKDGNKVVDAVGRSIDGRGSKWYRYGDSRKPFIVGDSNQAIIVEDCGSACSISDRVTGVALLGTSLLQEYVPQLLHYQKIYVALDKDATDKAIDMVKTLCRLVPTKLMVLPRDLKNMTKDERDDFLRNRIDR
jgi:DNA primase